MDQFTEDTVQLLKAMGPCIAKANSLLLQGDTVHSQEKVEELWRIIVKFVWAHDEVRASL